MSRKARENLRLALVGADGKMGHEIRALAPAVPINGENDWALVDPDKIDLVIDFSTPAGLAKALEWCVQNKKPIVSGTTGLGPAEEDHLRRASKRIPILYSANMSLGIAILVRAMVELAPLQDWNFQIEEVHHAQKKDRPSGTARLLQRELARATGAEISEPLSLRGGNVPGIHKIWAFGQDEYLTFEHHASNRRVFARGALKAATWLFDKGQPGLYDLSDLYKRSR